MAYHDDIGSTCCQRLISCTKDDIVGNIICQGMIIADDNQIIILLGLIAIRLTQYTIFGRIRKFFTLNGIIGTNNISMIDIRSCIIIAINHIILTTIYAIV